MLYLKIKEVMYALHDPVYVRRISNGIIVRCESSALAMGVVSPDEEEIWQLAGRPSLGEGYEVGEIVTQAEYDEWTALQEEGSLPEVPDPEDTEPVIPEGVDPATILTRAELTVKVTELDEALQLLLSGVTEDA